METKTYFVQVDKFGHYVHRYQDSKIVKTTRHFCDAKHFYQEDPHIYDGFKLLKVISSIYEV